MVFKKNVWGRRTQETKKQRKWHKFLANSRVQSQKMSTRNYVASLREHPVQLTWSLVGNLHIYTYRKIPQWYHSWMSASRMNFGEVFLDVPVDNMNTQVEWTASWITMAKGGWLVDHCQSATRFPTSIHSKSICWTPAVIQCSSRRLGYTAEKNNIPFS